MLNGQAGTGSLLVESLDRPGELLICADGPRLRLTSYSKWEGVRIQLDTFAVGGGSLTELRLI